MVLRAGLGAAWRGSLKGQPPTLACLVFGPLASKRGKQALRLRRFTGSGVSREAPSHPAYCGVPCGFGPLCALPVHGVCVREV